MVASDDSGVQDDESQNSILRPRPADIEGSGHGDRSSNQRSSRFIVTKAVISKNANGSSLTDDIVQPVPIPVNTTSEPVPTNDSGSSQLTVCDGETIDAAQRAPFLDACGKQYNTVTGCLNSASLLSSPQSRDDSTYNHSRTISFGHSNGSSLVVRQMLEWKDSNGHFVRKFSSVCPDDLVSEVATVPTGRDRWPYSVRGTWNRRSQFVLACLGYAVGLGNLWRFPYMCHKYGGGAFLVAYAVMLVVCGIPLMLMEFAVGQFTRLGPYGALSRLCPLLKGAGLAPVLTAFIFCSYYNVVVAWVLRYLFASFNHQLPWNHCPQTVNSSSCHRQVSLPDTVFNLSSPHHSLDSERYFYGDVLQISEGIERLGRVNWQLALTLLLAWILVYFSLWKSIKWSTKVLYCTVLVPCVLLVVFVCRMLTLPGAMHGLRYLFHPRWALLADPEVWMHAASQTFSSAGVALGAMLVFASYNRFDNRHLLADTLLVSAMNCATSLLAGVVVFATLGHVAHLRSERIEHVIESGPGLVFIVYPRVLSELPASQFWSFLFFFMLLCLGIDSQFATLEVVVTTVRDCWWPSIQPRVKRHELLVLIICSVSFFLGLPHVTQGGVYVFQLMDHYVAGVSMTLLAACEVITITWFYGTERLCQDIHQMTGQRPALYFRLCWRIAAPFLMLMSLMFSLSGGRVLRFAGYHFPEWSRAVGWCLASFSLLPVPIMAAVVLYQTPGTSFLEKLRISMIPDRTVISDVKFEPTVG